MDHRTKSRFAQLFGLIIVVLLSCQPGQHEVINTAPLQDSLALFDGPAEIDSLDVSEFIPSRVANIFIHCIATKEGTHTSPERLKEFFKNERHWDHYGYHWYITFDGKLHQMQPMDGDMKLQYSELAWGASGWNSTSIHISVEGGLDANGKPKDTRTEAQKIALHTIVAYYLAQDSGLIVRGHREVTNKACPSFDVHEEEWEKIIE